MGTVCCSMSVGFVLAISGGGFLGLDVAAGSVRSMSMCPVFWSAAQGGGSPNPPLFSCVSSWVFCVSTREGVGGGVEKRVFSSWSSESVLRSLCSLSESSITNVLCAVANGVSLSSSVTVMSSAFQSSSGVSSSLESSTIYGGGVPSDRSSVKSTVSFFLFFRYFWYACPL